MRWLGIALGFLVCLCLSSAGVVCAQGPNLPEEAQKVFEEMNARFDEIRKKAKEDVDAALDKCKKDLEGLVAQYSKDGKLDEAIATRDILRYLQNGAAYALPDPGDLEKYRDKVGTVFRFRVTGSTGGPLFGTEIYTTDSSLATAAVHAGVLQFGQTDDVLVTILPTKNSYRGSDRNGVSSRDWDEWPASFRVDKVPPPPMPMPQRGRGRGPMSQPNPETPDGA
jgi:hypothetical protein